MTDTCPVDTPWRISALNSLNPLLVYYRYVIRHVRTVTQPIDLSFKKRSKIVHLTMMGIPASTICKRLSPRIATCYPCCVFLYEVLLRSFDLAFLSLLTSLCQEVFENAFFRAQYLLTPIAKQFSTSKTQLFSWEFFDSITGTHVLLDLSYFFPCTFQYYF